MTADIPQNSTGGDHIVARIFDEIQISWYQTNVKGVRRDGDTGVAAQTRQGRALRRSQLERVHQRTKEQE